MSSRMEPLYTKAEIAMCEEDKFDFVAWLYDAAVGVRLGLPIYRPMTGLGADLAEEFSPSRGISERDIRDLTRRGFSSPVFVEATPDFPTWPAIFSLGRGSGLESRWTQHEHLAARGMMARTRHPRLGQLPKAHVTLAGLDSTGVAEDHDRLSTA